MEHEQPPDLAPGMTLGGKYEILQPLGAGAMGSVHVARHRVTNGIVALKVLHGDASRGAINVERFQREAAISAQVGHPGIVKVLDAGLDEASGRLWLAMELLEGETLGAKLERPGLSRRALVAWAREMLDALAAAHDAGYVHRDLKPENVFVLAAEGPARVKILDLGIARPVGQKSATQTGIAVGTPAYMSPEQALRPSAVGVRSDVWSFGAMVYEIISGAPPFDGESVHAIVLAASSERHVPLEEHCPWVPEELARLVDRCLAKDPDARPSARDVADALDVILGDPASAAALETESIVEQGPRATMRSSTHAMPLVSVRAERDRASARSPRRGRTAVALVTAVVLITLVIAAGMFGLEPSPAPLSVATRVNEPTVVAPVVTPPVTEMPDVAMEIEAETSPEPSEMAPEPPSAEPREAERRGRATPPRTRRADDEPSMPTTPDEPREAATAATERAAPQVAVPTTTTPPTTTSETATRRTATTTATTTTSPPRTITAPPRTTTAPPPPRARAEPPPFSF